MATRDILKTLQAEHDELRALFAEIEGTTDRAGTYGMFLHEGEAAISLIGQGMTRPASRQALHAICDVRRPARHLVAFGTLASR